MSLLMFCHVCDPGSPDLPATCITKPSLTPAQFAHINCAPQLPKAQLASYHLTTSPLTRTIIFLHCYGQEQSMLKIKTQDTSKAMTSLYHMENTGWGGRALFLCSPGWLHIVFHTLNGFLSCF